MTPIKWTMCLWVTSNCNLSCPYCNQKYGLAQHEGYDMELPELERFIKSSQDRNIHYYTIELFGGEPTLWAHLEEGTKLLFNSHICDKIMLVTNGNDPDRVIGISSMLAYWIVSKTQATKAQVKKFKHFKDKIVWNTTPHRPFPTEPDFSKLPAQCCCARDSYNVEQNRIVYLKNNVYYCVLAPSLAEYVNLKEHGLICSFDDDFIAKFGTKKYDAPVCAYCMCNNYIWRKYDLELR